MKEEVESCWQGEDRWRVEEEESNTDQLEKVQNRGVKQRTLPNESPVSQRVYNAVQVRVNERCNVFLLDFYFFITWVVMIWLNPPLITFYAKNWLSVTRALDAKNETPPIQKPLS